MGARVREISAATCRLGDISFHCRDEEDAYQK